MSENMSWLEVAVEVEREAVDAVAEVLRLHGQGVAIEEPFVQPHLEEAPRPDPARHPIVKTYLPDDPEGADARRAIEEALWHLGQLRSVGPLAVKSVVEEDWATAWRSFFPVLRLGKRIVVVPTWRRHRRADGEVVLRLDPGLAFGTGMHPTTRLCLEAAESLVEAGARVLDVGTGSGILAIAAARLGAREVVAMDIDPVAVGAARQNVRLNRVSRVVRVLEGTLEEDGVLCAPRTAERTPSPQPSHRGRRSQRPGEFDLVLANITARTNAALAPALAGALRQGGRLVASGILEGNLHLVVAAFDAVGLRTLEVRRDGDWTAVVATPGGAGLDVS